MPEIDARLGPLAHNPVLTPGEERLRLFDSLARFLEALAAPQGLLVVLDDLQDPADLDGLWPEGSSGRVLVTDASDGSATSPP